MFRRFAASFRRLSGMTALRLALPVAFLQLIWKPLQNNSPSINSQLAKLEIDKLQKFEMKPQYINKHLIIYQKIGNKQMDEVAEMLLDLYRDMFGSEQMKIIILNEGAINMQGMPFGITVIKMYSSDVQFVDFSYWGAKASSLEEFYSLVMKHVNRKIEQIPTIKTTNLPELPQLLSPDNDYVVVMRTNKDSSNYIKHRMKFEAFKKQTEMSGRSVKFYIVEDQQATEALGLTNAKQGVISVLAPKKNRNIKNRQECKTVQIGNIPYCIVEDASTDANLRQRFIFAPFVNDKYDYVITLKVNLNKMNGRYLKQLYKTFAETDLEYPIRLRYTNDHDSYSILMEKTDDDSEWILLDKQPKRQLTAEQKGKILRQPRTWKYSDEAVNSKQLKKWVNRVKSGKEQPYYSCEQEKPYDKYSNKLVGTTFNEILNSPNDEVVFYYSRHCGSCRRFGKLYELIALSYADQQSPIKFNRINSDRNKIKEGYNYNYTPVFAYFKKENKSRPFVYKRPYFTEEYFRDFIELTAQIRLLSDSSFDDAIEAAQSIL